MRRTPEMAVEGMQLVVNRTDDRVVVLLAGGDERAGERRHAVMGDEEAYVLSSAIRRFAKAREPSAMTVGSLATGLRIERVQHTALPVEIHLDGDECALIMDLSGDEASTLADMLWGAHRATGPFHVMRSLPRAPRLRPAVQSAVLPQHDPVLGDTARTVGEVARRLRGEEPEGKR